MTDLKKNLEKINQSSDSLKKLREINSGIKHFHEHTHILHDIRTFLGEKDVNFVEIGSYLGSSACLMLGHDLNTNVTCIDPLHLHFPGFEDQEAALRYNLDSNNPYSRDYKIYKNLSTDSSVLDSLEDADILHIDGNHTYDVVTQDFDLYKDKVRSGGFILFDDYHDYKYSPEVKPAVDHIVSNLDLSKFEDIGCLDNHHKLPTEANSTYSNYILHRI